MFSSRCFSAAAANGSGANFIQCCVGFGLFAGVHELGKCDVSIHPVGRDKPTHPPSAAR